MAKKIISMSLPDDMVVHMNELAEENGINKSAIVRQALRSYFDEGANTGQIVMNLVVLTQKIQDNKERISEQDYKEMENLINNITKLNGGIRYGNF